MKSLWTIVIGIFALVAAGLGFYFGVYRKPERRAKFTNFWISIGRGIKKYTLDLFKSNPKSATGSAPDVAPPVAEDAIPA